MRKALGAPYVGHNPMEDMTALDDTVSILQLLTLTLCTLMTPFASTVDSDQNRCQLDWRGILPAVLSRYPRLVL